MAPADEVTAASAQELGRDIAKWYEAFPEQAEGNDMKDYLNTYRCKTQDSDSG